MTPTPDPQSFIPGYRIRYLELDNACAFLVGQGWAGGVSFDEAIKALAQPAPALTYREAVEAAGGSFAAWDSMTDPTPDPLDPAWDALYAALGDDAAEDRGLPHWHHATGGTTPDPRERDKDGVFIERGAARNAIRDHRPLIEAALAQPVPALDFITWELAARFWIHYRCEMVGCEIVEQHEHGGGQPMREMMPAERAALAGDSE